MLVYRLEGENKSGVFTGKYVKKAWYNYAKSSGPDPYRHPEPEECPVLSEKNITHEHFFGFASVESMLAWFDNEKVRHGFREMDVHFNVYKVDKRNCMISPEQVVFKMSKATFVKRIPIP